jgi:hypothetical protein
MTGCRFGRLCRAVFTAACLAAIRPAHAQTIAVVTDLHGSVRVTAAGRARPVGWAAAVDEGAVLSLAQDARAVLAYPGTGLIYEIEGPGRFQARRDAVHALTAHGTVKRRDPAAVLRRLRIRRQGATLQASAAMR